MVSAWSASQGEMRNGTKDDRYGFPFAWEIAVIEWKGEGFKLDYSTPLTRDVEVFPTDEEANNFIRRAKELFDV